MQATVCDITEKLSNRW